MRTKTMFQSRMATVVRRSDVVPLRPILTCHVHLKFLRGQMCGWVRKRHKARTSLALHSTICGSRVTRLRAHVRPIMIPINPRAGRADMRDGASCCTTQALMHARNPQNSNSPSNKKVTTTSRCSTNQTCEWESAPNDSAFSGRGCMRCVHASGIGRRN
jgi:hypothetical protein